LSGKPRARRWVWVVLIFALPAGVLAGAVWMATHLLTGGTDVLATPYDVLAQPNEPVTLQVKLQRGIGLPDAVNEPVTFLLPDGQVLPATTDGEGLAGVTAKFDAPGDLTVPVALGERFAAVSFPDAGPPAVRVFLRPPDVPIAVCDIDHTLADISAAKVLQTPNERTPALAGSAEVLSRLAKTHFIVYLTARDDKLLNKTREWLAMNGFPDGPVFARDLGPDPLSARRFKTRWLTTFTASWPNVEYGFGDRDEDAAAYHAAGVRSFIVRGKPLEPGELPDSAQAVPDWAGIGERLFGPG
jgi:hypothetical protein